MKAYELHPAEPANVAANIRGANQHEWSALRLVERASPALGPRDVRVRVRAVSLNYRDLIVAKNARSRPTDAPKNIPASDGAGEVIEVGSAVTKWRVGDRVAANFFPTWANGPLGDEHHAAALGGSADGMLAEEVVLAEQAWVGIPADYSYEEAATLPCAAVTAWNALFVGAQLKPGDHVLVQGTGGVSIFALQLAKAAGARVLVTSSSEDKREMATRLGADHTLDYRSQPEWGELARAWAGGRGVDVVVEVGGPGTFDQSSLALRYGGTVSLLGVLTGTQGPINTHRIFQRNLRVAGIYVGSTEMFEDLVRALDATKIRPVIDRVFSFEEAQAAYAHLNGASHVGKVVIRV